MSAGTTLAGPPSSPSPATPAPRPSWNPRWLHRFSPATRYSLGVYLATRIAVVLGIAAAYLARRKVTWIGLAHRMDAWWYLYIAEHGYGRHLHLNDVTYFHQRFSPWAFFPGYPLLLRGLYSVTRIPWVPLALLTSFVLGALAVRAVYDLGLAYAGQRTAVGAALLFAAWPGSSVLNLPYSEGLFTAAAAASLAALLRRRWVLAGLFGAVATATRPMGLAVVAAAVVAAALEVRRSRSWRALAAPVLSALGVTGFLAYGWVQTGDPLVWRKAETLWHQRLDFSVHMVSTWPSVIGFHTRGGDRTLLQLAGMVFVAVVLIAAWRLRGQVNPMLAAYAAVALFMTLGYSAVGTRPRILLALLPAFCWLARKLPQRATDVTAGFLASTLALTTFLYLTVVTP
ncbi:MAG TPA: hypothetical protein VFT62_07110 [Mycobacteriales bacterium]|nr:hypothetical protein [Mycobacteriales bacterium]